MLTHDEARAKATRQGINIEHKCDERALECECSTGSPLFVTRRGLGFFGHAPGDNRCPNRAKHSACSYDQQTCDMLPMIERNPAELCVLVLCLANFAVLNILSSRARIDSEIIINLLELIVQMQMKNELTTFETEALERILHDKEESRHFPLIREALKKKKRMESVPRL